MQTRISGANPHSKLEPLDRQVTETNYLRGGDPAKWLRNVPSWNRVRYAQVYPGIDLVFYGKGRRLEYDFNVAPGADPSKIQLDFSGARRIHIDRSGDLVIETAAGDVRWEKPVIYQQYGAERKPVAGNFTLKRRNRVAFEIGAYDRARELVIDPTWSTRRISAAHVLYFHNPLRFRCGVLLRGFHPSASPRRFFKADRSCVNWTGQITY